MADAAKIASELLPKILEQERSLRFPSFSSTDAFEIGVAIRSRFLEAQKQGQYQGQGIVVSISTFSGHRLFSCSCGDDSSVGPENWVWVEGKTKHVGSNNHSSYYVGRKAVARGGQPQPYAHGGAFPIWLEGAPSAPYGVIVVSGLSQEDDHQIIVDILSTYIPKLKGTA